MTTTKEILQNGLKVILCENHFSPCVALQVWVNAGSCNEDDRESGISHLIEHMLFKGTEKRGVGDLAREIESAGGDINAFTTFDHTVYKIVIASRFFNTALDVLSDAVKNPRFDEQDIGKEKEVVIEEIKRSEDNPAQVVSRNLFNLSYTLHNYRRPVIGFESTVQNFSRDEIINYYNKWYKAPNMTLVITGDFEKNKILPLVKSHFSDLNGHFNPIIDKKIEPEQLKMRKRILFQNINEGYMNFSFPVPSALHEDTYPLDVFALIFGQGDSSRLYKRLKAERQIVNSFISHSFTPKDPGLFMINFALNSKNAKDALIEVIEELNFMKQNRVLPSELDKAKINIQRDLIYQKETVQGLARSLAYYEIVHNNFDFDRIYLEKINVVNEDDILKVARKYFDICRLNLMLLLPDEFRDSIDIDDFERVALDIEINADSNCVNINGQNKDAMRNEAYINYTTVTNEESNEGMQNYVHLNNKKIINTVRRDGLKIVVKENNQLPVLSVKVVFPAGTRLESPSNNGINNFIAEMLTRGTESRTNSEIADEIESIGGSLKATAGRNSICLSLEILSRFYQRGLNLALDVLFNAAFSENEIEKEREYTLEEIKNLEDHLPSLALKIFAKTHYGNHPCGLPLLGTQESVKDFRRDHLKCYYNSLLNTKNMVISVVGNVDRNEMIEYLDQKFLFNSSDKLLNSLPMPVKDHFSMITEYRDKKQAHIIIGFTGVDFLHSDRYSLEVLSSILSGQGGRLFVKLREEQSLAYSLTSFNVEGIEPGYLAIYVGTSPEKANTAIRAIKREIEELKNKKVLSSELERAKRSLVGNYEIELQQNSNQSLNIAYNELYGLGYNELYEYSNKVLKVSEEDIHKTCQKYLDYNQCTLAIVKPDDGISIEPFAE